MIKANPKYKPPADCYMCDVFGPAGGFIHVFHSAICYLWSLQELITEMIKANPKYKPPADYRPEKKYRKLRIAVHVLNCFELLMILCLQELNLIR
jgi:hypothetical protein